MLLATALVLAVFGRPAFASDPKQIYDESTNALYNLDFSTAQRGYETLTRDYPENPDYWNALASSIWLRITFDQQKLNIESFSGRTLGTRESQDAVNAAEEKRLRETIAVAISKADAILKMKPNDTHALYAKGISNGTLASFEATVKRAYINANSRAKAAHDLHEQVLKLDPTFDDALLGVGAYDYVIGVIPGFVRFLLSPFGVRSAGKEAGIQELETASSKGKTASTDAKMILIVVYTREKRYEQALQLLEAIHAKYPRNFLMELSKGSVYGKMQKWDDAERVYQDVLAKVQSKKDGYERLRLGRVYYALGASRMDAHEFEKSMDAFKYVVSGTDATPNERAGAYLWLGKLFDSRKDRTTALEQYDAVLALNCRADLKAEARRYRRRPFGE